MDQPHWLLIGMEDLEDLVVVVVDSPALQRLEVRQPLLKDSLEEAQQIQLQHTVLLAEVELEQLAKIQVAHPAERAALAYHLQLQEQLLQEVEEVAVEDTSLHPVEQEEMAEVELEEHKMERLELLELQILEVAAEEVLQITKPELLVDLVLLYLDI
jgi:hypothetical protein